MSQENNLSLVILRTILSVIIGKLTNYFICKSARI